VSRANDLDLFGAQSGESRVWEPCVLRACLAENQTVYDLDLGNDDF
jgi:hypothetical protein